MGAAQAVDVNINASSFSISAVTPGTLSFSGAGNVDGFGNFNATFDNDDGFSRSFTSASFTVTASGASWASASNVLVDNSNGFRAAAHIFVTGAQCGNGACATGFAANGPSHVVPEPATLLLVGGGLFGVGASAWKRRRR